MPVRIITIGKKHESWVLEGIERYQKRLKKPFDVEWVILPHSSFEGVQARQDESRRIFSRLNANDYVVLMDERGRNVTSPDLSQRLVSILDTSCPIVVIIGGAYGINETIMRRANFIWSLSNLVFPHQLVRLLLIEQLYRAQEIAGGGSYHHE
jgi:23S rRNA (pseudouridine1915-N3)-methyltransferase